MTNKELFVEYLKLNNMVPQNFNESDLPTWDMFNMDIQQPWEYYGAVTQPFADDIAQNPWGRQDWRSRNYRPGYNPWYGQGFNRPNFAPIFWWWLLFN